MAHIYASKMPALKKFDANVSRHIKLINKNLCANLIRHDYIVTGRTKAKRAQAEIEQFLAKTLNENKKLADKPLEERLQMIKALEFLQEKERAEIGSKVLEDLSKRYPERTHGFTRVVKLEPRLGEDRADMALLELVDSEFEIRFWYIAKIVARLELQGVEVDPLTQHNVKKLIQLRTDGENRFREAVETAKKEFFDYDPENDVVKSEQVKKNLENKPMLTDDFGNKRTTWARSQRYEVKPRSEKKDIKLPPPPV